MLTIEHDIQIYHLVEGCIPGSWRNGQSMKVPPIICWKPTASNEGEGHWVEVRTVTVTRRESASSWSHDA
jgi:hypothetical protein